MTATPGLSALGCFTRAALGTTATVLVTDDTVLPAAVDLLDTGLAEIDAACSRFREDSELSAVNAAAGRPVVVSPLFAEALTTALRAARVTDGAVDPTVGASLRALGYDDDFARVARAGSEPVAAPVPVPGWNTVRWDPAHRTVILPPGVQLDLGATAKALAADRIAAAVAAATPTGVLVNLGGDLAVAGPPPPGGWLVRVTDDHAAGDDTPGQTLSVTDGGVATSSTTVRAWQRGRDRLHHIVDPATGRPARRVWRTVSVAAGNCVDANTAATAAIVRGADAEAWLLSVGLPARLVHEDGHVVTLGGWPQDDGGRP